MIDKFVKEWKLWSIFKLKWQEKLANLCYFSVKKWKKNFGRKFSAKFERKKDSQRREGFSRPPKWKPRASEITITETRQIISLSAWLHLKDKLGNSKTSISALKGIPHKKIRTNLLSSALCILVFFVQQRHHRCFRALTKNNPQFSRSWWTDFFKKLMHRKE